nr:probable pre-mRNA-splicing factor ATP-dependent RNA helicase DEAH4 isoform X1 [Tanacetum cinerariifolium]
DHETIKTSQDDSDFESTKFPTADSLIRTGLPLNKSRPDPRESQDFPYVTESETYSLGRPETFSNANGTITSIGKTMAELPLEPSLARTLIEANKNDCLPQALTVAAMLSVEGTILPGRSEHTDKKRKQPPLELPDGSGWGTKDAFCKNCEETDVSNNAEVYKRVHPSSVLRTDDEGVFPNYKLEKLNVKILRVSIHMLAVIPLGCYVLLSMITCAWTLVFIHLRIYQHANEIVDLKQSNCSIKIYYHKLKGLWDEMDAIEAPYAYSSAKAYSMLRQEEKQRKTQKQHPNTPIALNTYRNPYSYSYNSSQRNNNPNQPNTRSERRNTFRKGIFCGYCKKKGHSKEECFKLPGYPVGHALHKYLPHSQRTQSNNRPRIVNMVTDEISSSKDPTSSQATSLELTSKSAPNEVNARMDQLQSQ